MHLVSALQMSRMDKKTIEEYGIPGAVLMENAGRGATRLLMENFGDLSGKKIGVIAGRGNNGGDGFVIARYLAEQNIDAVAYLLSETKKVKGDAALNLGLLPPINVPVIEITDQKKLLDNKPAMLNCDIWVDAIFGTGLNSEVTGFFKSVISFINSLGKPVLAVDIPSGLHPDKGVPLGISIRADVTATFGFAKTGHITYPGAGYCGRIGIIDIGIPNHIASGESLSTHLLTPETICSYFIKRETEAHKGSTGHLFILAGSKGKSGAAVMASRSAMRIGAGLVTVGTPESQAETVSSMHAEAMTLPLPETKNAALSKQAIDKAIKAMHDKKCLAIGPGLGTENQTADLVTTLLKKIACPVIIDADALNCIAEKPDVLHEIKAPALLTPHPGEMARLTDRTTTEIQADRIGSAADFAKKFKVTLVLKGAGTVIAHPDGNVYINQTGNPAMASGGMGDVLTGIIAGLITQGYPTEEAARTGVYLHGLAGDILSEKKGPAGILATDITEILPSLIRMMAEKKLPPLKRVGQYL